MNIAILHTEMGFGGIERVLSILSKQWVDHGHSVTFIWLFDSDTNPYDFNYSGKIKMISASSLPSGKIAFRIGLRRLVTPLHLDVIVSFNRWCNYIVSSTFLYKIKTVISERGNLGINQTPFSERIRQRIFFPWADKMVFQSERARELGLKVFGVPLRKTQVIFNPLDSKCLQNSPSKMPSKNIVGMGRLTKEKGFDILIRAFSLIAYKHKTWHLFLYGDGNMKDELQQLCKDLQMDSQIHFPGFCNEVGSVYHATDIFVLPSYQEGFPNALLEAMSCGCACIASDCLFGPREMINDTQNGFLFPVGDIEACAEKLDLLITDESLRHRIGNRASEMRYGYQAGHIAKQWEEMFQRILGHESI